MTALLVTVIVIALIFDFTNGFHDAANAVATSISTRAVPPQVALFGAAVLNVIGALVSTEVAATLAKGIVDADAVTLPVILGGVVGAIFWNLVTWYWALPNSSSHCLIGGVAGAALATSGMDAVQWAAIVEKVLIPTVGAPLFGFTIGITLMVGLTWMLRKSHPAPTMRRFRVFQLLSASFMAYSHGKNDAQKTMGIITLALYSAGSITELVVPLWVKLASALVIGLGTYSGGKRIIRTLGMQLVKLDPVQGFAAETAASAVLMTTAELGFPVSTTHVITSSVMGVGATRRLSAVKWGVSRNIFIAWVTTLPIAGLVGALFAKLAVLFFG